MSLGMQEILPDGGLASFQNEVSKLADLGRYEDAYIVHAAEGETIVPMAVFDENPRLKAMLFAQMRGMGIDPQRYIVGNEFNSINPITGQPEFFLKKIFKEAKKAVKKIAPYAGLIAGAMGAGPGYAALIGAGAPLLAGQGVGEALMGGIGGYGAGKAFGTAGWAGGAKEGIFGGGDYIFGAKDGALSQLQSNLGFGAKKTAGIDAEIAQKVGAAEGTTVEQIIAAGGEPYERYSRLVKHGIIKNPASAMTGWEKSILFGLPAVAAGSEYFSGDKKDKTVDWGPTYVDWGGNFAAPGVTVADGGIIQKFENGGKVDIDIKEIENLMEYNEMTYEEAKEYLENLKRKEMNTGGIVQLAEGTGPRGVHPGTEEPGITGIGDAVPALLSDRLQEEQDKQTMPYGEMMNKQMMNFLIEEFEQGPTDFERKYGNEVTETIRRILGVRTKEDLARDQGAIFGDNSSEIVGYNIANGGIINSYNKDQEYTESKYADGGIAHLSAGAFPRMTGAIAGPGGPKDDMVPAMLSDGEFVMTAEAVRNAGGGDRREGARRMYQLMNQLQGAA